MTIGSFFRLLVGVCIYFVGGIIYMHFVRHAQGIEKIPHHLFWIGLPGLVKVCTFSYRFAIHSYCYHFYAYCSIVVANCCSCAVAFPYFKEYLRVVMAMPYLYHTQSSSVGDWRKNEKENATLRSTCRTNMYLCLFLFQVQLTFTISW